MKMRPLKIALYRGFVLFSAIFAIHTNHTKTANWGPPVLKYIVPIEILDRYSAYHQISKILDSLCKMKIN